jgi:hypothetical protein
MIPRRPVPTPVAHPGAGRCAWTQGEETEPPVAPQPSALPNATPQLIKGGDIKVS